MALNWTTALIAAGFSWFAAWTAPGQNLLVAAGLFVAGMCVGGAVGMSGQKNVETRL